MSVRTPPVQKRHPGDGRAGMVSASTANVARVRQAPPLAMRRKKARQPGVKCRRSGTSGAVLKLVEFDFRGVGARRQTQMNSES